jgi:DNA invertase Pin-like site-specific DNA recombinase
MKPVVAYVRVSTSQQGRSGPGIETQREALTRFAATEGLEIVAEFVEIETDKGSDALDRRPQLVASLAMARSPRSPTTRRVLVTARRYARAPSSPALTYLAWPTRHTAIRKSRMTFI